MAIRKGSEKQPDPERGLAHQSPWLYNLPAASANHPQRKNTPQKINMEHNHVFALSFFLHHQSLSDEWLSPIIQSHLNHFVGSRNSLSLRSMTPSQHWGPGLHQAKKTQMRKFFKPTKESILVPSGPLPELNPRRVGGNPKLKTERLFQSRQLYRHTYWNIIRTCLRAVLFPSPPEFVWWMVVTNHSKSLKSFCWLKKLLIFAINDPQPALRTWPTPGKKTQMRKFFKPTKESILVPSTDSSLAWSR